MLPFEQNLSHYYAVERQIDRWPSGTQVVNVVSLGARAIGDQQF